MMVQYIHLTYEDYKALEEQMRAFAETSHKSEGGFYHKSIRLKIDGSLIMEFHGPLVGGYGHQEPAPVEPHKPSPQAAGGHARAAVLAPQRRTEIATKAARLRWARDAG